jgi:hypothetical protein
LKEERGMKNKLCAGLLVAMAGGYLLRRAGLRWGATDEEVHKPLAGDEIVPHPMLETSHTVPIEASAEEIWPWLVQMGHYRALSMPFVLVGGEFLTTRKMLYGIKRRVEGAGQATEGRPRVLRKG